MMVCSRHRVPWIVWAWTFWLLAVGSAAGAEQHPRLKVLFLGDRGHHQPHLRAATLVPLMADRGIDITYTQRLSDLQPAVLSGYQVLLVYANIDELDATSARSLLDYVAGGGGLVALHCASYCFRNQPEVVALIGGQFLKHGIGEFDVAVAAADHPIMKGLQSFATWDETYEHHLHNAQGRTVLQTRANGDVAEPWTWVRTHGSGRVFYTAYGHDHRTWHQPGFHALVERGIRWAAGQEQVFDSSLRPPTGPAPFEYAEVTEGLPTYQRGTAWGTAGESLSRVQRPLAAALSKGRWATPAPFDVRLFASEPQIGKPLCLAWDARGRLWISETVDYPHDLRPPGKGNDRIKICDDTDGDGTADKFTIFADRLSIVTGIAFANGGVVVHQAPHTLFLRDIDGDDKADVRHVLFSGWGTQDTHAGPNNLRYGLDNWLYSMVGYSGFDGEVGGERHQFRQGIVRFRSDGSKLEYLRSTSNNSWGLGFSEDGLLFGSTANGCPSVYLPIANKYYERVRGWSAQRLENIAPDFRYFPITNRVRQVDFFDGFTAAAGHALYTARRYPRPYWNRAAFVAEPTGHLVAVFQLVPNGSDFSACFAGNLAASDDEWTAPIAAEVGPDGNVWVADWYNIIVQHNPTPAGYETGKGGAYVTSLRDKSHGRVYRVVVRDAPGPGSHQKSLQLDAASDKELVEALSNDNMLWRLQAQRLLIERALHHLAPQLVDLIQRQFADEVGLNPPAMHALGVLHGWGLLDGKHDEVTQACRAALRHPAAGVRRMAIQCLPRSPENLDTLLAANVLYDSDAQVRLATFLAIADSTVSSTAGEAVAVAVFAAESNADRWILEAATSAAATHDLAFLRATALRAFRPPLAPAKRLLCSRVAEHYARGAPWDSLESLIEPLAEADVQLAACVVEGLAHGWPGGQPPAKYDRLDAPLKVLLPRLPGSARVPLIRLAERWGSRALESQVAGVAAELLSRAADRDAADSDRLAAASQLISWRNDDADFVRRVLQIVDARASGELSLGLIQAAAKSKSADVGDLLIERWPSLTPELRRQAVQAFTSRREWVERLLKGVEQGEISLGDWSLDQKQVLTLHPDAAIASRATDLFARLGVLPSPDRQRAIESIAPLVLSGGRSEQGRGVYRAHCAKCHVYSNEGTRIGPDLTGVAVHSRRELLEQILDPNRSVEGNYQVYTIATDDGRVLSGLLVGESKTAIEVLDAEAKRHALLRDELESLHTRGKSLMPEGFEKQLDVQQTADLLAFLTARGRFTPLDLRRVANVVSTRDMFFERDSKSERLVFADWSPKSFSGVPFQLVDPQGSRTCNVIMLNGPRGIIPPRMPRSVALPVNARIRMFHLLSGVSGWGHAGGQPRRSVTMIVRLHYADGQAEEHPLLDGVHFADYIDHRIEVPGSKFAFRLRDQQIRYLVVSPLRRSVIDRIELVKGDDDTAPLVMAITAESGE